MVREFKRWGWRWGGKPEHLKSSELPKPSAPKVYGDKVICLGSRFIALELKAKTTQSEAQKKFQTRVESLGGLYILAHGKDELKAALVNAFGEDAILGWEAAGRAREKALRMPKRNY